MSEIANVDRLGFLERTFNPEILSPLKTDLYQFTMGQGYFNQQEHEDTSSFYMHWRKPPFGGTYTVAAGLEGVVDFLKHFKITESDLEYLRHQKKSNGEPLFTEAFLEYLKDMKLDINVDAVPEGTVMTAPGPVIRITGPKLQCQLVESAILNIINASSMVATRAARIDEALNGNGVFADFSLRRQPDLGLAAARAAHIGGAKAVADVNAGKMLGIPITGTMAHSWIQDFLKKFDKPADAERAAFVEWCTENRGNNVLLVDTFDPYEGMRNAIWAAQHTGVPLDGIRFDSGDLYALSWEAHRMLEAARQTHPHLFAKTEIFLTNDLDENKINQFQERSRSETGKPFPARRFGVGTSLGNPGPLGGVYKVSAVQSRGNFDDVTYRDDAGNETKIIRTMKVAGRDPKDASLPGPKSSLPGVQLDTLRLRDAEGRILTDVLVDCALEQSSNPMEFDAVKQRRGISLADNRSEITLPQAASAETLLKPVLRRRGKGQASEYVYDAPPAKESYPGGPMVTDLKFLQEHCKAQRNALPRAMREIENPERFPTFLDLKINDKRKGIMEALNKAEEKPMATNIDILIDPQNGFARYDIPKEKGQCLYVPGGEQVGPAIANLMQNTRDGIFVFSQDFHPANHMSFMDNHPGVVEYRQQQLIAQGKDPAQVHNPLELPFTELVLKRDGTILGIKEGERVRKVEVQTADGSAPNDKDQGRVTKVLESYFDEPFHAMKAIRTQLLWTDHCVQGTESAHFLPEIPLPADFRKMIESDLTSPTLEYFDKDTGNRYFVVRKGMNPEIDSYGIALENDKRTQTMAPEIFAKIADQLQDQGVSEVNLNIGGLATNFCVEFSHNNIHDLIVGIFKVRGIEAHVNFVQDISRGIPIPGDKNVPFSNDGAPDRMASYSERGTKVVTTEGLLRARKPSPEVAGDLAVQGPEQQASRGVA